MRTTVELPEEQYAALRTLAARRGTRGFSLLVSEAIDLLLAREHDRSVDEVLALRGSFTEEEADALEAQMHEVREGPWRAT